MTQTDSTKPVSKLRQAIADVLYTKVAKVDPPSEPNEVTAPELTEEEAWAQAWAKVEAVLPQAKGICYDGCHKIYILLDDEQVDLMKSYDYEVITPDLDTLKTWFYNSCGLEFVQSIKTDKRDPNAGFTDLIEQGFGHEYETEEDED